MPRGGRPCCRGRRHSRRSRFRCCARSPKSCHADRPRPRRHPSSRFRPWPIAACASRFCQRAAAGCSLGQKLIRLGFCGLSAQVSDLRKLARPCLEGTRQPDVRHHPSRRAGPDGVTCLPAPACLKPDRQRRWRSVPASSGGRKPVCAPPAWAELDHSIAVKISGGTAIAGSSAARPTPTPWPNGWPGCATTSGSITPDFGERSAIRCVAAPIRIGGQRIIAAVSVHRPASTRTASACRD